jgi:hypothetical protein
MNTLHNQLLSLANLRFRIFPCYGFDAEKQQCTCGDANCGSAGKHPRFRGWQELATNDPEQICRWLTESNGRYNWAIATGNGFGVLDVDPKNGGDKSWGELFVECRLIDQTLETLTGSRGRHIYFRMPDDVCLGNRTGFRPGLDWRGDGGYVLIPPSLHRCGQRYEWATPIETPLALAPACLLEALRKPRSMRPLSVSMNHLSTNGKLFEHVVSDEPDRIIPTNGIVTMVTVGSVEDLDCEGVEEGQRNNALCRRVGVHIARGESLEEIEKRALAWNTKCQPPQEADDVLKTVSCLWDKDRKRKEEAKVSPPPPAQRSPSPVTVLGDDSFSASDVQKEGSNSGENNSFLPGAEAQGTKLIPSFPASESGASSSFVSPVSESDPSLEPNAYHGLLGEIVRVVDPKTEADPPAILLCLLACFGNAVGFDPHFHHGKPHGANLFVGLVGPTASRKGTALGIAKHIVGEVDDVWKSTRFAHEGFGSGEGLVWAVRDANGDDVGVADKRFLVAEEEWAKAFTLGNADKSILTPIIRGAFDRIPIGKRNRGDNAYSCQTPHISILANITPDELQQALSGKAAVSIANGFVNRFLLCWTERRKFLSRGGDWRGLTAPFVKPLADALAVARTRTLMELDAEAGKLWDEEYQRLESRPAGVIGNVTARASDQCMKIALVFALADRASQIGVAHLRAALAVWRYCEASARKIFGSGAGSTKGEAIQPEPLSIRLHNAIIDLPGISRSELLRGFRQNKAEEIDKALEWLRENGHAYCRERQAEGGGRPAECWYPREPGPLEGRN